MRFVFVLFVVILCLTSNAQSLQNHQKFTIALPKDFADAPALITITDSLYDYLQLEQLGLERSIFFQAYKGYLHLLINNKLNNANVLTIADYSQSCNNKRLYVIDIVNMQLLYNTYVSHGKNSGYEFANSFSNEQDSNKSSIGFLITGETYFGKYGTALRLDGIEKNINHNVRKRDIVLHGSNFVNEQRIALRGSIARSLGCPAIPKKEHIGIIQNIKDGSCFFIFHPSKTYAKKSKILNATINLESLYNQNYITAL